MGINEFLKTILEWIYGFVGNYGWAVVLFTLLVRLIVMPFDYKSRVGMRKMQKIAPMQAKLQKKYEKDPDKMNKKLQELYREQRVNPLSSCLPMLISMVILFAMFYALRIFANEQLVSQFLTFYHNPEIDPHTLVEPFLWIKNLWMPDSPFATYMPDVQSLRMVDFKVWNDVSAKLVAAGTIPEALNFANANDLANYITQVVTPFVSSAAYAPYIAPVVGLGNLNILGIIRFSIYQEGNGWFLLPILSVVSQIFMQKLTMKNTQMDPSQESSQKMMIYVMTFMSLYFCASYNSAFALYWVVSNIYAIIEQIGFNKYFEQQDRKASKAEEVGI